MKHKQVRVFLEKQVSTRFWMFVLLSGSTGAGYATNRLFLISGLGHPGWRYGVAILASYAALILGVRVWLGWVIDWLRDADRRNTQKQMAQPESDTGEGVLSEVVDGATDAAGDVIEEVVDGVADSLSRTASSLTNHASSVLNTHSAQMPSLSDSADSGFLRGIVDGIGELLSGIAKGIGKAISSVFEGLSGSDDAAPLLILILVILLAVAVLGGWMYLIVIAPEILGEVALQFLLSSAILPGLRPAMRYAKGTEEMDHAPWMRALMKKTAIPFAIVLVIGLGLGFSMHSMNPEARTLKEFFAPPVEAVSGSAEAQPSSPNEN